MEGVQPSIPQNPTTADSRAQELVPKGPGANPNISAINGNDNVTVKPLVKHILSKELLLYFEKVCGALLDEANDEYRLAALASIRTDPGLHQLVPYFVQFIAEKVTHNLKDLFILTQMVNLTSSMLENDSLYVDPYVSLALRHLTYTHELADCITDPANTDLSRGATTWSSSNRNRKWFN